MMKKNNKEMRALRFIIFFIGLALTLVIGARDWMMPQPYDLVVEADEHGMLARPASLPFYYPNEPHLDRLHIRFKLDHHMFSSGRYLVRANCLERLYLGEKLIFRAPTDRKCDTSWQTDMDLSTYLQPGSNQFYATIKSVRDEHVHFHMRPCYVFGFC